VPGEPRSPGSRPRGPASRRPARQTRSSRRRGRQDGGTRTTHKAWPLRDGTGRVSLALGGHSVHHRARRRDGLNQEDSGPADLVHEARARFERASRILPSDGTVEPQRTRPPPAAPRVAPDRPRRGPGRACGRSGRAGRSSPIVGPSRPAPFAAEQPARIGSKLGAELATQPPIAYNPNPAFSLPISDNLNDLRLKPRACTMPPKRRHASLMG
jgi:hypothetical protein